MLPVLHKLTVLLVLSCLLGCENRFISGQKLATMGANIDLRPGPRPVDIIQVSAPTPTPRPDFDNDGLADEEEYLVGRATSLVTYQTFQTYDTDNDGVPNWKDTDSDGDGVNDGEDSSPTDRYNTLGPTFAVWWSMSAAGSGSFVAFPNSAATAANPEIRNFSNATIGLTAQIKKLPDDEWELTLQNTGANHIHSVVFPYPVHKYQMNHSTEDDRLYHPFRMGKVHRMKNAQGNWLSDFTSNDISVTYPGNVVSPLTILADDTDARIVASTTFPPKTVSPYWDMKRQYLKFLDPIPTGSDAQVYRVLVKHVSGDASQGRVPWQIAADAYKSRLRAWMTTVNLNPKNVPAWMKTVHGWMAVGAQNQADFRQNKIEEQWNRWKNDFSWIQIWGQMSNHPGPNQFPAPLPNEVFGCCTGFTDLHARYTDPTLLGGKKSFPELAAMVTGEGGRFGYYSRPRMVSDPSLIGSGELYYLDSDAVLPAVNVTAMDYLVQWITKQKNQWGANAYYVDVLACARWAQDAMFIPDLYRNNPSVFENAAHECQIDFYPTLGLVSGGMALTGPGYGGEFDSLENMPLISDVMFGRYLMDDHLLLMGHSNNDHIYYGRQNNYWGERQVLLTGMKFDLGFSGIVESNNSADTTGPMNHAVRQVLESRNALNWWDQEARFRATNGLSNFPDGIRATRFQGRTGQEFIAIDNFRARAPTVTLHFDGAARTYLIPMDGPTNQRKMMVLCPANPNDGPCR